jgi:hypothetical protein
MSIFADFLNITSFAKEADRSERTILRWMDDGLPYSRLGSKVLIHVPTARQWLLDQATNRRKTPKSRKKTAITAHAAATLRESR